MPNKPVSHAGEGKAVGFTPKKFLDLLATTRSGDDRNRLNQSCE